MGGAVMSNAPKQVWITGTRTSGSWNSTPATMRNPPEETKYVRADEVERLREQNRLLAMDKIELRGRLAALEAHTPKEPKGCKH